MTRIENRDNLLTDPMTVEQKLWEAHLRLQTLYGEQELISRREPMRELISTVLSHRTTHANEEEAYWRMFEKFGTWEGIRDAPYEELVKALSPAQFPEPKAAYIQKILTQIFKERGEANIDFLKEMSLEEGLTWLYSLPGVGLKTAALVLLFNFHKPVLPVDTHVHRVTQRLGVIGSKVTPDKAHPVLLSLLPKEPKVLFNFHKHFYWHGQRVCKWAEPKCSQCPLPSICNWYQEHRATNKSEKIPVDN
ncbi:endonuclease III domain-containing protein [Xanthocytophaga flava]|uniref:endonuclease III domain-containing protein n=1 Tax=Xanthocytophaga flava TaxID=3048013 RepID=UPI0028D3EFE4|nr:endonuclease III [Xanthocytophaga flavus]MDJ1469851.1 endonuclease III [Xanthocytophaga flavus]